MDESNPLSILLLLPLAIAFTGYFLPSIVAFKKKRVNRNAILVLNLCLGWTFLGWVVSLIWSLIEDKSVTY